MHTVYFEHGLISVLANKVPFPNFVLKKVQMDKSKFEKYSANSAFSFLGKRPQTKTRNCRKIKFELFLTERICEKVSE